MSGKYFKSFNASRHIYSLYIQEDLQSGKMSILLLTRFLNTSQKYALIAR